MKKVKINVRSFERDGCHVIQKPSETKLMECSSEYETISGKLSLSSKLFYLGVVDSGEDSFRVSLNVKRPTRWQDGEPETFTVVREFLLSVSDIKKWILGLETVILDAIFVEENTDGEATEVRENHAVMKMLLELTEDFTELNRAIKEDAAKRQNLLDSH